MRRPSSPAQRAIKSHWVIRREVRVPLTRAWAVPLKSRWKRSWPEPDTATETAANMAIHTFRTIIMLLCQCVWFLVSVSGSDQLLRYEQYRSARPVSYWGVHPIFQWTASVSRTADVPVGSNILRKLRIEDSHVGERNGRFRTDRLSLPHRKVRRQQYSAQMKRRTFHVPRNANAAPIEYRPRTASVPGGSNVVCTARPGISSDPGTQTPPPVI